MGNKNLRITILTILIPIILQLIYIRYVSYEVNKSDYGDFIILSTFVVALSQIFLSIPSQSFMRFFNSSNKLLLINEFRTYLIGVNLISIVLIYSLYLFYGDRFDNSIYILLYIYFLFSNNYSLNQQIFLLNMERKRYFILKLMEGLAKFIFPIIFYILYETLESLLIGLVVGYIIAFIIISIYLKEYPFKIEFNIQNQKKYFIYAYPIMFSAVFSWSISFSDRYFIDYFMSSEDVGIYAILAQVAGFAQILGMVFGTYVNPIVLKKYEENKEDGFILLKSYLIKFMIISLMSFLILIILPRDIFTLIVEKDIIYNDNYYSILLILIAGIFSTVFQTAMSMYFILLKRLDVHAKIFIIASITNFLLNFYILEYGIIAAAFSTFLAYLILNILMLFWLRKNIITKGNTK